MIGPTIFEALQGLVGGRVYPARSPEREVRPYITYQQVGGMIESDLDGADELQNASIQINVWDDSDEGAATVMLAVKATLEVPPIKAVPSTAPIDTHEADTDYYGKRCDFSIWY